MLAERECIDELCLIWTRLFDFLRIPSFLGQVNCQNPRVLRRCMPHVGDTNKATNSHEFATPLKTFKSKEFYSQLLSSCYISF